MFVSHYHRLPLQVGGSRTASCLNILRRGQIIDFSINFEQHQNHYNFFTSDIVPVFLDVVYRNFVPKTNVKYKFQGFIELLNWKVFKTKCIRRPPRGLLRFIDSKLLIV